MTLSTLRAASLALSLALAASPGFAQSPPPGAAVFKNPAAAAMAEGLARGDTNAVLLGRARGVDANIQGVGGQRPIHYVVRYAYDLSLGSLRALASAGADVSATDDAGNTPLGLAAARQSGQAVQILLGFSASPKKLSAGKLPLQIAAERGNRQAFEQLAIYGPLSGPSYDQGSMAGDLAAAGKFEWILWMTRRNLISARAETSAFWSRTCASRDDFAQVLRAQLATQGFDGCKSR